MKQLPWNNQTHNNDEMFSKGFMSILRTPNCHF